MSNYALKVKRRRLKTIPEAAVEPEDAFSFIPDFAVRRYCRAKAGMYNMTQMSHRLLRIEVGVATYKRMLGYAKSNIHVAITPDNAVALGELAREQLHHRQRVDVWSVDMGGRMKAVVLQASEATCMNIECLALKLKPRPFGRPVTRAFRRSGIMAHSSGGRIV